MPNKETPMNVSPVMGYRVEEKFAADGTQIAPSTLANEAAEANPGHNPDFFKSDGSTREEQNAVGKGANPSADVVTKNTTTIDPVFIEPSPTADGRVVPLTVPASLPVNSPITEPSGHVHAVGETPQGDLATSGTLVQGQMVKGAGLDGEIKPAEVIQPAKIVPQEISDEEKDKKAAAAAKSAAPDPAFSPTADSTKVAKTVTPEQVKTPAMTTPVPAPAAATTAKTDVTKK